MQTAGPTAAEDLQDGQRWHPPAVPVASRQATLSGGACRGLRRGAVLAASIGMNETQTGTCNTSAGKATPGKLSQLRWDSCPVHFCETC